MRLFSPRRLASDHPIFIPPAVMLFGVILLWCQCRHLRDKLLKKFRKTPPPPSVPPAPSYTTLKELAGMNDEEWERYIDIESRR